jgi:hypothetical protein
MQIINLFQRNKQHGTGILARASWVCHNMAEKRKRNQLHAEGIHVCVSKEIRDWGGVLFITISSHRN